MFSGFSLILSDARFRVPAITLLLLGFTSASIIPFQSLIALTEFKVGAEGYSVMIFVASVVNIGGSVALGHVSDRIKDRGLLVVSLCCLGTVGFGAVYLHQTLAAFIVITVLVMPLCNCVNPLVFGAIRKSALGLERGLANSVTSASRAMFSCSWAIAPGLVGLWLAGSTLMSAYAIACLASLISVILYLRTGGSNPPVDEWQDHKIGSSLRRLARMEVLIGVALASALLCLPRLSNIITPLIITDELGGATSDVGINSALVAFLEIPFMIAWGAAHKRLSSAQLLASGALIYSVYLALLSHASHLWEIYGLLPINACGAAALLSIPITYLQDLISERPGLGSSLIAIGTCLGSGLAALIFGSSADAQGYSAAALIGCALGVATGVILVLREKLSGRRPLRARHGGR